MTTYLPRSAWTPTTASGATLTGTLLRGVAVHWPGTSQDRIGDPGQAAIAERLRHYRNYHLMRGWRDIGYNLAIDQAGRVWMLRSTSWAGNMVGAHCASSANPDANREYVGVLLLLGDQELLSDAMIEAFRHWYHTWFLLTWPNRRDVRGHGQVPGASTECPGAFARAVMGELTTPPQGDDDDMFNPATHITQIAEKVWHTLIHNPVTGTDVQAQVFVQSINSNAWRAVNGLRALAKDPNLDPGTTAAIERALNAKTLADLVPPGEGDPVNP